MLERVELLFRGGAGEIGGPYCLQVKTEKTNLIIDCGLGVSGSEGSEKTKFPDLSNLGELDGALITHGHLDHIGAVPLLVRQTKVKKIRMSHPSLDFGSRLHWEDTLRIPIKKWCRRRQKTPIRMYQEMSGDYYGPINWDMFVFLAQENGIDLPFDFSDIKQAKRAVDFVRPGDTFFLGRAKIRAVEAGHILGALGYLLEVGGKRIYVSGDFSMQATRHSLIGRFNPAEVGPVDCLVVNATYAGSQLRPYADEKRRFLTDIKKYIKQGRQILVPVFAIDRAQKIFMALKEAGLEKYVFISGSATKGCRIYFYHTQKPRGADKRFYSYRLFGHYSQTISRRLRSRSPAIWLVTSGMVMEDSPSHTIAGLLFGHKKTAAIMKVGYAAPETPGRQIELAASNGRLISWHGRKRKIECPVSSYQFSAHAPEEEIAAAIKALRPKLTIYAHCEPERVEKFLSRYPVPGRQMVAGNKNKKEIFV